MFSAEELSSMSSDTTTVNSLPSREIEIDFIKRTTKEISKSINTVHLTVLNKTLFDPIVKLSYTHDYEKTSTTSFEEAKQFLNQIYDPLLKCYQKNNMQEGLISIKITSKQVEPDKLKKISDEYQNSI